MDFLSKNLYTSMKNYYIINTYARGKKMQKKMIFFDIDGTLITEGTHRLPQSTVKAVEKAKENGHLLFINTGRTFFNIGQDIRSIGFSGYVCGCGTYIHYNEAPILSYTIPHETCLEIINLLRECQLSAMFEGTNGVFFDYSRPATGDLARLQAKFGAENFDISKSWDNPDLVFDKFVTWKDERCDFKTFITKITENFDYIDRGNGFGEVVPKGYSKATGIQFLQNYFGISLENCFAIGDSTNDLPMLEYVPNSIAMGNSTPILFDKVAFVTKNIEDDGIAYALKHYGII